MLVVNASVALSLLGCASTQTKPTNTSVQNTFSKKSDRWYDIRRDHSIAFGEFRTGPVSRVGTRGGVQSKIRLAGFGVNKEKANGALAFTLSGPAGSVDVNCGGHVNEKNVEIMGVELPTDVREDHFRGTIQFEDGAVWSFNLDGFNRTTAMDKLEGTIHTDLGPITIRKSSSGSKIIRVFEGFSGAVFEWKGQTVGEISKQMGLSTSANGDISVTENAPPNIRLAVAGVAAALILAKQVETDIEI